MGIVVITGVGVVSTGMVGTELVPGFEIVLFNAGMVAISRWRRSLELTILNITKSETGIIHKYFLSNIKAKMTAPQKAKIEILEAVNVKI